jgi:hypothetical protein
LRSGMHETGSRVRAGPSARSVAAFRDAPNRLSGMRRRVDATCRCVPAQTEMPPIRAGGPPSSSVAFLAPAMV